MAGNTCIFITLANICGIVPKQVVYVKEIWFYHIDALQGDETKDFQ
jgi:hypothetical protein